MTNITQTKANPSAPDGLDSLMQSSEFQAIAAEASKLRLVFLIAGRTGVGKSSTINSLLGRQVAPVGDYEPTTFQVQQYPVELEGIPFNVVDTPGLCDDLEEQDKDSAYIAKMQTALKEFHSLWFVTKLDDTRVSSDEKRAIRLLSQAFPDKGAVWQSALIVFTFAGRVTPEEYANALAKRTELIRREIAIHAGPGVATNVPSVAVENTADTTPDGKPWRGELYVRVMTSMKREGIITYLLGIPVQPKPRRLDTDHDRDRSDRTGRSESRQRWWDRLNRDDDESERRSSTWSVKSSDLTPEHRETIRQTVQQEIVRRCEERGRSFGESVGRFLGGSSGASTGGNIGASVGRAVGRAASWLFG